MRTALLILILASVVVANCASYSITGTGNAGLSQAISTSAAATLSPSGQHRHGSNDADTEKQDIPVEFRNIDFKNFSYRVRLPAKSIRLQNGKYEYRDPENIGGNSIELVDVNYTDLDADGKKEAVVHLLQVSCGGSCDGGSHLFYFYSIRRGKVWLLTRMETGSLGYGECGLRSFVLERSRLVLETFHVCRFEGPTLKPTYDPHPNPDAKVGKFVADKITRFVLSFRDNGRSFSGGVFHLRKREVLPNPKKDLLNYHSRVSISNN